MKSLKTLRLPALLAAVGAFALLAPPATAGTDTANLTVSASVAANCTISTSALEFGAYDPIVSHKAAALDGTGSVTITCTNGAPVTVMLGQGTNAAAESNDTVPLRRMASGANNLAYFLYSNVERNAVWGNHADADVDRVGTGDAQVLTVYGRITNDQQVPTGDYSDTVVATVTF